nr:hypothetical protein [Bacteroides reticulotermitis]
MKSSFKVLGKKCNCNVNITSYRAPYFCSFGYIERHAVRDFAKNIRTQIDSVHTSLC